MLSKGLLFVKSYCLLVNALDYSLIPSFLGTFTTVPSVLLQIMPSFL